MTNETNPNISPAAQKITVVACPIELWSEVIEVLQDLPFKDVGRLMSKLAQLAPQEVEVQQR